MITIKTEFETRTTMGLTKCTADKTVYRDYRDVEHVEEVVSYVKKLFNGKLNNPSVDFVCEDGTLYGHTICRYFRDWKDGKQGISRVRFGNYGSVETDFMDKLTAKEIRNAYIECANWQNDYEEGKEVG